MSRGIWTSETTFEAFSEPAPRDLVGHIATRARSGDFSSFFGLLPNPDSVLRKMGKQIDVYRELASDAHVKGCLRRRRGAVKAMERGFERGKAPSRVVKALESIFEALPLSRIIEQACGAADFGYQPFEVLWGDRDGLKVPIEVVAKPPEWFGFDNDNQLRFKSREALVQGELLPPLRFFVPRNNASYINPYGEADLASVFWPTTFKRGGLKFWVTFTEKYGTPWAVGKLPRTATAEETKKLAADLEGMVRDAVAAIPDDSSVELLSVSSGANAELFERLLHFCRSETSIALLGNNQSIEASANLASAQAAQTVEADLRDAMAEMVVEGLNELVRMIVTVNWGDGAPAPLYRLWEQEEVDEKLAKRDQVLTQAGARFTTQYFMRAYTLEAGDLAAEPAPAARAPAPVQFAEGAPVPADQAALDAAIEQLPAQAIDQAMRTLLQPALDAIAGAQTFDGVRQALAEAYPKMDSTALEALMHQAFFVADLWGAGNALEG